MMESLEMRFLYTADSPVEYNGHNYVLDRVDGEGKTISTDKDANVVNVYYARDEKGIDPEDPNQPNNPDGTADKYQVAFTYVAGAHGSVDGTLAEVVTRPDNSTTAPVKAEAKSDCNTGQRISFVDWTTQDGQHYADVEAIRAAEFDKDTVFTANFAEDGNVVINYAATEGGSVTPVNEIPGTCNRKCSWFYRCSSRRIPVRELDRCRRKRCQHRRLILHLQK